MRSTSTGQSSATLEYDAQAVSLPAGESLVGRNSESFLRIDDPAVSRDHLRLQVGDVVTIEDLDSTNGTLLNGERIDGVVRIMDGDELTIGSRTFCLRLRAMGGAEPGDDETQPIVIPPGVRDPDATQPGLGGSGAHLLERTCPNCGPVPLSTINCPECGFQWPEGAPEHATAPDHLAIVPVRGSGRYTVRMGAHYTSKRLQVDAVVQELSDSGVFVVTNAVDVVGAQCRLELFTSDGDCAEVAGFVKRVIHKGVGGITGMGIAFSPLSGMNARWIAAQIKRSCAADASS